MLTCVPIKDENCMANFTITSYFIQTNILVYDMLINLKVCSEKLIEQLLVGLPIVTRIEGFYEEVGGKL